MRLLTWNVNGLRSVERKGFLPWLQQDQPDLLCLQETKARPDQLSDALRAGHGYHAAWASARKPGYSGVATLSLRKPDEIQLGLGDPRFDDEGRLIVTRFNDLAIFNGYFPNGQEDHARVPYKLDFTRAVLQQARDRVNDGQRVVVCGDWNTAHQRIDLARPSQNTKSTGFLPHERAEIDAWLDAGFCDIFRDLYPQQAGAYTWWSFRLDARARNVGWRIDYHLISRNLRPHVADARILAHVTGSDHCPVELQLLEAP